MDGAFLIKARVEQTHTNQAAFPQPGLWAHEGETGGSEREGGSVAQGEREGCGPEAEEMEAAGLALTQENCPKGKAEKARLRTSWVN